MKYISNSFIKKLIYSIDIVEFISSKIFLRKIGNKYISNCPFHKDNNPSFIVNKEEKFYYCFGCKSHGNIIDFLMYYNNISFIDSIKELSYLNNIKLNYISYIDNKKSVNYKYFYFNKLISKLSILYHRSLLYIKELYFVRKFLFKRGLNINIIKKFFLGFSYKEIINKFIYNLNKFELNFLIKYGFFIKDINKKIYDRLYDRIIFPIYDIYNNIIAFGGRTINKYNFIKYINSSKNFFFIKKNCLYNLNNIRKRYIRLDKIIVVEGYLDVITLSKFGIYYVVGLLGSSISSKQIKILYFYTNKIIFCYDGDKSGINSIYRTIKIILNYINENNKSFFILLPNKEDPDSIIKKEGIKKFKYRIKKSISVLDLLFYFISCKYNLCTYEGKISFIKSFMSIINYLKSSIIKLFLLKKISYRIGFNENKLINLCNFSFKKIFIKKKRKIFLRYLISLLLKNPKFSFLVNLSDELFNIKVFGLSIFLKIINFCILNVNINFNSIIKNFSNLRIKLYLEYLFFYNFFSKNTNDKLIFLNILNNFKIYLINKKIKKIFFYSKFYGWNLKRKKEIWYLIKLKNFKNNLKNF